MIELKTAKEIEEMKPAGRFVGEILKELKAMTKVGTNLLEINPAISPQGCRSSALSTFREVDLVPRERLSAFREVVRARYPRYHCPTVVGIMRFPERLYSAINPSKCR